MCGFAGIVDDLSAVDREVIEAMTRSLAHRGPDASGAYVEGGVGLGARRLAILGIDNGDQPMANPDRTLWVAYNGEIFNYPQLRKEAEASGYKFQTRCDTEILLALYELEGDNFIEKLRGMFAFALWDNRRRRLLVARDRFGIKPFYYSRSASRFVFASELKALRCDPRLSLEIDREAVASFLAFNSIPGSQTIFRDTRKLPAGYLGVWEEGKLELKRYARPAPAKVEDIIHRPQDDLVAELRSRLSNSVQAHLLSDVPVGVLLSGGVDSSLLTAIAAQVSVEPIHTFSIGFHEQTFNELDLARLTAERYDTVHHELIVEPNAVELLPEIVRAFDEPFADSSALPTYLVSQLASQHVKVVLSGEGGDELFGGYETYAAHLLAGRFGPAAGLLKPFSRIMPHGRGRIGLDYKFSRFVAAAQLSPVERHHAFKEIFSAAAREEVLEASQVISDYDPIDRYRERFAETEGCEPLVRMQDLDIGFYLVDDLLVKTDRMSMVHSLEARVPFLDPVVAEMALALPTSMTVRGFKKKILLREAARSLVPKEVLAAKKRGFSIPAARWLRGELVPFAREVLSHERLRTQGILDPSAVNQLLESHIGGESDLSRQLWGLISLTLWNDGLSRQPTQVESVHTEQSAIDAEAVGTR